LKEADKTHNLIDASIHANSYDLIVNSVDESNMSIDLDAYEEEKDKSGLLDMTSSLK